jgi:hypothetical protein
MNMIKNKASEREEIEALLPWHAAGTLSRREALKVEHALASDADLAIQYETVRQDLVETIGLNESLGAPSARAMQKLMFVNEQQGGATFGTASVSVKSNETVKPGTDALISFAPQATAAEITKLLQTYKMAIVEGPTGEMYTVRLAVTGIPKEELARIIKQLQDEKAVRFVGQKSAD